MIMDFLIYAFILVLIVAIVVLSIVLYRSLTTITAYENSYDDIYNIIVPLNENLNSVLSRSLYSNERDVVEMVNRLSELQEIIAVLSNQSDGERV